MAHDDPMDAWQRRARRQAVVVEHMESENVQAWDRTMATFSHPRYELPDGTVFDGHDAVMRYWVEGRRIVPDQCNELIELVHLDADRVLIRFWLRGTPVTTAQPFETVLWAVYDFDGDDRISGERVYADEPTSDQISGRVTADERPLGGPASAG